jgi:hypothetical protein
MHSARGGGGGGVDMISCGTSMVIEQNIVMQN